MATSSTAGLPWKRENVLVEIPHERCIVRCSCYFEQDMRTEGHGHGSKISMIRHANSKTWTNLVSALCNSESKTRQKNCHFTSARAIACDMKLCWTFNTVETSKRSRLLSIPFPCGIGKFVLLKSHIMLLVCSCVCVWEKNVWVTWMTNIHSHIIKLVCYNT